MAMRLRAFTQPRARGRIRRGAACRRPKRRTGPCQNPKGGNHVMPFIDSETSRRRFLQFLATSPLVATSNLAALSALGAEMPSREPDPMIWAPRDPNYVISSPKEANSVFDLEIVMHK